jgi:hypothetical protein
LVLILTAAYIFLMVGPRALLLNTHTDCSFFLEH